MKTTIRFRFPFFIHMCALMLLINSSNVVAGPIALFDWAFNVDGTISENFFGDPMPTSGYLDSSGLGTLSMDFTGAGSHSFTSFFDFEIDEPLNSFYNEYGSANGTVAVGQSWEIDEPSYFFGDIYDNLLAGSLDNTNTVPAGLEEDVSFAMGWDFALLAGETAVVELVLSDVLSTSGFYLAHMDDTSSSTVYLWSTLTVNTVSVPEPGSLLLIGVGLAGLMRFRRKK